MAERRKPRRLTIRVGTRIRSFRLGAAMRLAPIVLVPAFLATATPAEPQRAGSAAQRILDIHNRERAAQGAQPLRWNGQLERDATSHAQQIARAGQLVHAPRAGRGVARENIGKAPLGWGVDQLMGIWVAEKRYFRGGVYPDVCTGGWLVCAHYTQMIWPATTDIGCGIAAGSAFSWIVCRYSPGGNKDGWRLGAAVDRLPSGTPGPVDSAKSRQRLGTPGQASTRSNIDAFCNPPSRPQRPGAAEEARKAQERRDQLKAEIKELQKAIKLLQAGLEEELDPSLIEQITGIRIGATPSDEQLRILSDRLRQRMEEVAAEQDRIEKMIAEMQDREHLETILCKDR